jgi:uncharacterized protein YndB with AHSA1/START domain
MTTFAVKTMELTVTRTIPASAADVFDVWIDSTSPGSPWFGTARAIVQPVVDGLFYHSVQFEGHDWAHYGRFIVLDRPRRIEHTWVSEATRGLESVVTLTFEPRGDQTLVQLRHANIPDDELAVATRKAGASYSVRSQTVHQALGKVDMTKRREMSKSDSCTTAAARCNRPRLV